MTYSTVPAGAECDAKISEMMEPRPTQEKTYRQLEREDGGNYTCWSVKSKGGWWKIEVDWGEVERNGLVDTLAEWTPAHDTSDDPAAAYELQRWLVGQGYIITTTTRKAGSIVTLDRGEGQCFTAEGETWMLAQSRAALAAKEKSHA